MSFNMGIVMLITMSTWHRKVLLFDIDMCKCRKRMDNNRLNLKSYHISMANLVLVKIYTI